MFIEDTAWPYPHHPCRPDEQGDGVVPDLDVVVEVFQLRPLTVSACAAWCGGAEVTVNGGAALLLDGGVVGLGDYVVHAGDRYVAEPAAGFAQRYQPAQG